jgi:hypothetical protein
METARGKKKAASADAALAFRKALFGRRENEEAERAGLHFAATLTGGGSFEIGGNEENLVAVGVDSHGAGALLGGHVFGGGPSVARLLDDG